MSNTPGDFLPAWKRSKPSSILATEDPEGFVECFIAHVTTLRPELVGELIAIDGKTVRHSFKDGDPDKSIHLISAWASGSGLSPG